MKWNWGTKIAILYTGFVVMIVTLVAATFRHKPSLVAEDYYQRETVFQQRLEAQEAASSLGAPPRLHTSGDSLCVDLPRNASGHVASGTLTFYAPSDPGADKSIAFNTLDGRIHAAVPATQTRYILQLDWHVAGVRYYSEIPGPWTR